MLYPPAFQSYTLVKRWGAWGQAYKSIITEHVPKTLDDLYFDMHVLLTIRRSSDILVQTTQGQTMGPKGSLMPNRLTAFIFNCAFDGNNDTTCDHHTTVDRVQVHRLAPAFPNIS